MNLSKLRDKLDSREPQPELDPAKTLAWCIAGMVGILIWCGLMHWAGVW